MERYCIDNKEEKGKKEKDGNSILQVDENGIRIHKFTLLEAAINGVEMLYPECQHMMNEILNNIENQCFAGTKEIMYQDILASVCNEEIVLLDIYLHMYYTVLYKKRKDRLTALAGGLIDKSLVADESIELMHVNDEEDCIVALAGGKKAKICENCSSQKKLKKCGDCNNSKKCNDYKNYKEYRDVIRGKRKNFNDYNKKTEEERNLPFNIINIQVIKEANKGEIYYGESSILNFAPEVTRLYFLSEKFRKIFTAGKKSSEKFSYINVINIFKENNSTIEIKQFEEIWLLERLLGINLAWKFYTFFRKILSAEEIYRVEKSYGEIITKIVRSVMQWGGMFSRCLIVENLKLICEISIAGSNKKFSNFPRDLLEYLYEEILCKIMEDMAKYYKTEEIRIYNLGIKTGSVDNILRMLVKECESLSGKYIIKNDGYYFLKQNNEDIMLKEEQKEINSKEIENLKKAKEDGMDDMKESNSKSIEEMRKELKDKEKAERNAEDFDKRLYALIQKIIICE